MSIPSPLTLLASVLAAGAAAAVPASPAPGAPLLAPAVEAMGGAAAVDALRTLEVHGVTTRPLEGGRTIEVQMITYAQPPDRLRQEVRMPAAWAYSLLNPDGAFFVVVNRSLLPLEGADRVRLAAELRSIPVVLMQERGRPGFQAVAAGTRVIDGKAADLVEVTVPGLPPITVALDPTTGLVRELSAKKDDTAAEERVVWSFSDYRPVEGGLKYPFRSRGRRGTEEVVDFRVEKVLVNRPLDARVFKTPAPATFINPDAPGGPLPRPAPPATASQPSVPAPAPSPVPSPRAR